MNQYRIGLFCRCLSESRGPGDRSRASALSICQELSPCSGSPESGIAGYGVSVRFHLAIDDWQRRAIRRHRAPGIERGAADAIPDRLTEDSSAAQSPAPSSLRFSRRRSRSVKRSIANATSSPVRPIGSNSRPSKFASWQTPRPACSMASRRWYSCSNRANGRLLLPEGEITDWPDLQLRLIFWDDAHHVERIDAFKRIIRQAAFFKINAIALKLEGHFQFKSAPALVEPYAWTPAGVAGTDQLRLASSRATDPVGRRSRARRFYSQAS